MGVGHRAIDEFPAPQSNSVSMTGPRDGWAAGRQPSKEDSDRTLAEPWNGNVWSAVTTPDAGTGNNMLIGDAAMSQTEAWTVECSFPSTRQTLAEFWNGTGWSAWTA